MPRSMPVKALCLVLVLALVGCTQAQVLTDLDVAAAAIATVATIPGIPPPYAIYISDTATALDCVAAAVQKGGTTGAVAIAIAACGLSAIGPSVPPGTAQTIVAAVNAVVVAVQKVVADQPIAVAALRAGGGETKFKLGFRGDAKVHKIRLSLTDSKAKLPRG